MDAQLSKKKVVIPQPQTKKRFYKNTVQVDSDLFKLEVAKMQKNISWVEGAPEYIPIEHCHLFHTHDSDGKAMQSSSAVGGHFHVMTIKFDGDGVPVVECSGPKKFIRKQVGLKSVKQMVDVRDDHHTHTVTYLESQKVKQRQINTDAVNVHAAEENKLAEKLAPIPGIS